METFGFTKDPNTGVPGIRPIHQPTPPLQLKLFLYTTSEIVVIALTFAYKMTQDNQRLRCDNTK